jgi:predicted RNA-binding Zn ribbon-like protein
MTHSMSTAYDNAESADCRRLGRQVGCTAQSGAAKPTWRPMDCSAAPSASPGRRTAVGEGSADDCRHPWTGLAAMRQRTLARARPFRNGRAMSTPYLCADNTAKTVKANGYVKRTPTWPMATVPYSIGERPPDELTQVRTVVNLSSYAELAVRLANTVQTPGELDPLGTASACTSALGDCLNGPVTRRDLAVLQHLRTEFNAMFTAAASGDEQAAMDRLNALLLQFPIHPEMVNHDDQRWHVHLAAQGAVGDRFAAGAIIGVALTVSLVGVSRLGVCAIASCHQVFIDASRAKSRRYCAEHAAPRGNVSALRRPQGSAADEADGGSPAGLPRHATPAAS